MSRLPPPGDPEVRSIWVLRLSSLGDVLLCEPAVAALAERFPAARMTVVTRARYHDLFSEHPAVDVVLTPRATREGAPPDLAVDLHNRLETRWPARRARRRVRWRERGARDLLAGIFGRPLHRDDRGGPHQVERQAQALGLATPRRPRLYLAEAWIRAAVGRLGPDTRPLILLLPASSHPLKAWPPAGFAEVGRAAVAAGARVVVGGGPGEGELLRAVAAAAGAESLPCGISVGEMAAVLARARVAVGNDGGLLHVAAAVGTRVVSVFGPTPHGRWGPAAHQGVAVSLELACSPCSDSGGRSCRRRDQACLRDLPPALVIRALQGFQ